MQIKLKWKERPSRHDIRSDDFIVVKIENKTLKRLETVEPGHPTKNEFFFSGPGGINGILVIHQDNKGKEVRVSTNRNVRGIEFWATQKPRNGILTKLKLKGGKKLAKALDEMGKKAMDSITADKKRGLMHVDVKPGIGPVTVVHRKPRKRKLSKVQKAAKKFLDVGN